MKIKVKRPDKSIIFYLILAAAVITAAATSIVLGKEKHDTVVIYKDTATLPAESKEVTETEITTVTTAAKTAAKSKTEASSKTATTKTATTKKTTTEKTSKTTTAKTSRQTQAVTVTTVYETQAEETAYTEEQYTQPVSFPIDVNRVTFEELTAINGIGEVTADAILGYRSSVGVIYNMDMLLDVNGIGGSTLALLKEYLYVSSEDYRDIETTVKETAAETTTSAAASQKVTQPLSTTTKRQTTTAATTLKETTTTTTTAEPVRQPVEINNATAEELEEKLLIDRELAESIIELRDEIQYFVNPRELLYADGMSKELLSELIEYIIIT